MSVGLAGLLGRASTRPDINYRVTILNSATANAFALPAGYLYVTRGLLALANNEAELAGVLAHEIGHVAARHPAQRYSQTLLAQSLFSILGPSGGGSDLGNLAAPAAQLALTSFSRGHEHEADELAVTTLARAGFDPRAMPSFLRKLERQQARQGSGAAGIGELFSTHPRTAERVERTIRAAKGARVRDPMWGQDIYMQMIDGLVYGDDPAAGLVRGRQYHDSGLGLSFAVPSGFTLARQSGGALAKGPNGATIRFDRTVKSTGREKTLAPERYLTRVWADGLPLRNVRRLNLNGFDAAQGTLQFNDSQTPKDLTLVVLRGRDGALQRFYFAYPRSERRRLAGTVEQTLRSLRPLNRSEAANLQPLRLKTRRVRPGESLRHLARQFPQENDFYALNGLSPGERLRRGQWIKVVVR